MKPKSKNKSKVVKITLLSVLLIILVSAIACNSIPFLNQVSQKGENQGFQIPQPTEPLSENDNQETDNEELEESSTSPDTVGSFQEDVDLVKLFEAFWNARELLHDNYLEQPIDDQVLANGAIEGLNLFLEGNNASLSEIELPEDAPTPEETAKQAKTPKDVTQAFLPFWEAWNKLSYLELPEDTTKTTLMRQALTGMVASLEDPYTNYFDPDLAEQMNIHLGGEYEGIGAYVDVGLEYLTIISSFEGSPADEAGLKPGDQIIAIDGDDMTGVDPSIALKRVLGDAGTKVILTIKRENLETPFDVEIIRRKITIPNIESEILEGNIAYLKLLSFYDGGDVAVRNTLDDLLSKNPKALIFDLRGNGGGFLHTVVNITSEFIEDGNVLIEEFSDGSQKNYPIRNSKGVALEIPLVVLVDEGSASASEIFAGAIQDNGRGILVGQTTFGKGSVQLPITLPDDQGLIRITIARWLTPNERTIHEIGIEPDFIVELTEDDFDSDRDPQLEKAIELLTSNP
ncbi:MAG: PDZ domain-containing protein [Aliifodinibius sp.]|nr:PDZ domain-containing protein [Fodinibius sp.]